MTWKEWYSDSPRAIVRRGLIVAPIGAAIALLVQLCFGGHASRPLWAGVFVSVALTLLKLDFGNLSKIKNQPDGTTGNERKI